MQVLCKNFAVVVKSWHFALRLSFVSSWTQVASARNAAPAVQKARDLQEMMTMFYSVTGRYTVYNRVKYSNLIKNNKKIADMIT